MDLTEINNMRQRAKPKSGWRRSMRIPSILWSDVSRAIIFESFLKWLFVDIHPNGQLRNNIYLNNGFAVANIYFWASHTKPLDTDKSMKNVALNWIRHSMDATEWKAIHRHKLIQELDVSMRSCIKYLQIHRTVYDLIETVRFSFGVWSLCVCVRCVVRGNILTWKISNVNRMLGISGCVQLYCPMEQPQQQ